VSTFSWQPYFYLRLFAFICGPISSPHLRLFAFICGKISSREKSAELELAYV